jgi:ribosomal protein L7/L12
LGNWLFLRLETDRDELRYRFLHGLKLVRGSAPWENVTLTSRPDGIILRVPGHQATVPTTLAHYPDFLRDMESHLPQSSVPAPAPTPATEMGDLDPEIRKKIQTEINAVRTIQAIQLLRQNTGLGLQEAKEQIERWAETRPAATVDASTTSPTNPAHKRRGAVVGWLTMYLVQLLFLIYA